MPDYNLAMEGMVEKMRLHTGLTVAAVLLLAWLPAASASELEEATVESDLVPTPVEYNVVLPPGYKTAGEPFPLLLFLHGGRGTRANIALVRRPLDELWAEGDFPRMVIVAPTVTGRSFYMDFPDGSEKWETFIAGPFLEHLRKTYKVRKDRRGTLVTGASMGGMGALRLAFKHPDVFGAVAAMEAGIEPVMEWNQMRMKHRFWRSDELMQRAYGKPVDQEYWAENNPATIATRHADRIRRSGLKIYLEAGDQDMFWLYEGSEFLHRVLYDGKIRHEYHLVHGADHVGGALGERSREVVEFLAKTLQPSAPDPRVKATRRLIDPLKARLKEADHYEIDTHLIGK